MSGFEYDTSLCSSLVLPVGLNTITKICVESLNMCEMGFGVWGLGFGVWGLGFGV